MTAIFTPSNARKSYDGVVRFALDNGSANTVLEFPAVRVTPYVRENNAYPAMMDSSQIRVDKVAGLVTGGVALSGAVKVDHGIDTWLNAAWGPRNTSGTVPALYPYTMTILPNAGGAPQVMNGVYWDSFQMTARFGVNGGTTMLMFAATALILDPKNVLAAGELAAATNEGLIGVGISQFGSNVVSNGASSGAVDYDNVTSLSFGLSNGMDIIPAQYPGQPRMAAGAAPGQLAGSLVLVQMTPCTHALPATGQVEPYPLTAQIPSADGTKTLRLDTSCSYDGLSETYTPGGLQTEGVNYTLFGTTATNGLTTAAWSFLAGVA